MIGKLISDALKTDFCTVITTVRSAVFKNDDGKYFYFKFSQQISSFNRNKGYSKFILRAISILIIMHTGLGTKDSTPTHSVCCCMRERLSPRRRAG